MEEVKHPSIYVAPLNIVKPTSDLTTSESETRFSQPELPLHPMNEMTPPLTPQDANHISNQPAFHNYLRAFYPFQPTTSVSPSTVTLPLNAGNIILVHSIHTNGWADGTLLDTGARGWLPTNYCEGYSHIPMRPLLKALTEFWDVIHSRTDAILESFRGQDYMRGLIAGVRFLLEKSDCLTRDASIVKKHDNIRRARKALLSDLSSLVKIAKILQDIVLGLPSVRTLDEIFSEISLKAFKIVVRGVRFLDVWTEEVGSNRDIESVTAVRRRPRSQDDGTSLIPSADVEEGIDKVPKAITATAHGSDTSPKIEKSMVYAASSRKRSYPTGVDAQPFPGDRRVSAYGKRTSVSHRMPFGGQSTAFANPNLASERLRSSHDAFLGCLGTFLGLHMQSRSSSELLLTTQQSVKSCRGLLTVIEIVLDHDMHRSEDLVKAKDAMYDNITDLAHAARKVFRPVNSADEDMVFMPDEGNRLFCAARDCVRGAGECVAMTRSVLERIGDFEPEAAELQSLVVSIGSLSPSGQVAMTSQACNADSGEHHSHHDDACKKKKAPPQLEIPDYVIVASSSSLSPSFEIPQPQSHPFIRSANANRSSNDSPVSIDSFRPLSTDDTHPVPEEELATSEPTVYSSPTLCQESTFSARSIVNSTGSSATYTSSGRDSEMSVPSQVSTQATSPGDVSQQVDGGELKCGSSGSHTIVADECDETEAKVMEKTFAHELMYNKEGQVTGGTLSALIEKLTAYHSAPDALFVSTFYLTFRLFATPQEFAEALSDRFNYIGETRSVAGPVRLRVYNVFKGWLEAHWRHDCDDVALPFILDFARNSLTEVLPTAGKRLTELGEKVAAVHGPLVPRLVSSIGKTNTSIAQYVNPDTPVPSPIISRTQLTALRTWKMGGPNVSILDFDPLELARQITIKESAIFCSILPEELLATEWMKRSGSLAVNVRAMSTLSTDLANLVADSILQLEEPKKRALLIKQWVKIANKCVELKNYDSIMAIVCSLNSSTIARLKKTWEVVSQKTKATLEELKKIVDVSRNYVVLRQRLQGHVPPCLPFVGIYLTDLTFVDHGNQTTRQLTTEEGSMELINYDKHMKTARIISELQRFQIPYRLTEVPELQTWMQDQLVRVRSAGEKSFQNYYRRSLILEPKEQAQSRVSPTGNNPHGKASDKSFDFLGWAHAHRDKSIATNG